MCSSDFTKPDRAGSLAGKRILFFAVRYFAYEQQIMDELRRRGAHVDYLPDRPFNTPLMTAITRYSRTGIMYFADRFYRQKLAEFGNKKYDLVFVINGQTLSKNLLNELRGQNPDARFLFYIWDSMRNKPKAKEILPFFDECITFDPDAADKYGMRLLPLFFVPGFEAKPTKLKYDLSFIGTAHSDRFHIISEINKNLGSHVTRFWYLFLQAKWVFPVKKILNSAFKNAKFDDFRYEPLKFAEVQKIFFESKAIVDIEHPHQRGLTMRTFEALGAEKKLITTNSHIKDYDFYNPNNIHIIDRKSPVVPKAVIDSPYQGIPKKIYYKYSLSGWMDSVLKYSFPVGT